MSGRTRCNRRKRRRYRDRSQQRHQLSDIAWQQGLAGFQSVDEECGHLGLLHELDDRGCTIDGPAETRPCRPAAVDADAC